MNNPPDLSICLSVNFIINFGDGLSVSIRVKGQREDRTRTTRYSCNTVVGHVIVDQETCVLTELDHQSGTSNDILLCVHKKIFASVQMLLAMSQRC